MTEGNGIRPAGVLTPLRRNRFFYGKLMDTRHWELEQEYGIRARQLVNRLGLGAGILCGLGLRIADGGVVCVAPGVAVDACGREIVVDATVAIEHVDQPTDAGGKPSGEPVRNGDVTIWLCYHECGSEYTRLADGDCGHHDRCVPGLLDERFALRVVAGVPDRLPGLSSEACQSIFPGSVDGPPRREVVASLLAGPCTDPADCCIPLGTVRIDDGGAPTLVGVEHRTPLYSNEELFDLLMCLASRVEQCCHHHPAKLAPRVMDVWPPLAGEIPDDQLLAFHQERRLEIAFERDMRDLALDQPDPWLGVWQITQEGTARLPLARAGGAFLHVAPQPGQDAVAYDVDVDGERNSADVAYVVMMRAQPGGDVAASDDGAALDADFAGTGLLDDDRAKLWELAPDRTVQPPQVRDHLLLPASPALPSGDGVEGGELHGAVARAQVVETTPPPQLLRVWPRGATVLDANDPATQKDLGRFLERPHIELVVSRAVAEQSMYDVDMWAHVYTTNRDGRIFGFVPVPAKFATAATDGEGVVTISIDLEPEIASRDRAEVLVIVRPGAAPPASAPMGVDPPTDLLDADFDGTSLDKQTVITIFEEGPTDPIDDLVALPTDGVTLHDGSAGGLLHYSFIVNGVQPG